MNGFAEHGRQEDPFGPKEEGMVNGLKTFDAFPKTKPNYTSASRRGGQLTVIIFIVCSILSISELWTWARGNENQHFSVEKGVSRELQMNLDLVVHMLCEDLRVNVQDAAGDRILAGDLLKREGTSWSLWTEKVNKEIGMSADKRDIVHEYQILNAEDNQRIMAQEEDAHVRHVVSEVRRNYRRKFPKSPSLRRGDKIDACRIYGSLEGNKVQGDFHITARGHGYQDLGGHLDHKMFNFSHMITELSFGPHYPTLLNPLDKTMSSTEVHYFKYQYFLNLVPTIYTKGNGALSTYTQAATSQALSSSPMSSTSMMVPPEVLLTKKKNMIFTNQYSATSQSRSLPESPYYVPGIFFKYNIEPILLLVSEERGSFLALMVRLVNVVSGVIVSGGWVFQLSSWFSEVVNRRRARRKSEGVLNGRLHEKHDD